MPSKSRRSPRAKGRSIESGRPQTSRRANPTRERRQGKPPDAGNRAEITLIRESARVEYERWLDANHQLEAALRRYTALYDEAPTGYATLSPSGVIEEINRTGAAMLGQVPRVAVGRPFIVYVARPDQRAFLQHLLRCRRSVSRVTSEVVLGTTVIVELVSHRTWLSGGKAAYHTVITDLTERRRAEQALALSEQRYREIVETANEGICIVDRLEAITFLNRRFARMLGGEIQDFLGRPLETFLPPEPDRRLPAFSAHDAVRAAPTQAHLVRLDGTSLWTSVSTSVLRDNTGEPSGMLHMFTDISDRKELEATRERLVRRLVSAQEAERRRVSRELHDSMGQHLVGFSLSLKRLAQLAQKSASSSEEIGRLTARLQEMTAVMAREVHTLARGLRPAALDDLGLGVAVSNYADEIADRAGLDIDVHCTTAGRVDPATETTVYRVVQEALTNIVKHAKAKHASVIVEQHGDVLQAIIEDDGVGFAADRWLDMEGRSERLGLAGMKERASLIGGDLQIESSPGRGTTLFLRVPVGSKENDDEEVTVAAG